jgi:hypothetical protein
MCVCLQYDLTWEMRLQMLHDVAQGMSYLHSHGQIHGELCSNSLLVAADGKVDWDWGDCIWSRLHTMFNTVCTSTLGQHGHGANTIAASTPDHVGM